jgi:hypothetical protein
MTKKELKRIMLEVIAEADQYDKDSWYCTDQEVTQVGIEALAKKLNIDLDKED